VTGYNLQSPAHAGSSLADFSLLPWRWYIPPKRRFTEYLLRVTSQKTAFFIVTAVKTSNLTKYEMFAKTYRSKNYTFFGYNNHIIKPCLVGYCLFACDTVQSGKTLHMFWSELLRPYLEHSACCFFVCLLRLLFDSRWGRQYISPKQWHISTRLHGMSFRRIVASARLSQPCL
jgi:hypothetical protein